MKRKLFCLLTLLLTVCSGAWADSSVTFTGSELVLDERSQNNHLSISKSPITIAVADGNEAQIRQKDSNKTLQFNNGAKFVVSGTEATITSVVFTTSSEINADRFSASPSSSSSSENDTDKEYTYNFTGSSSITFTVSANTKVSQIVVTYTTGGGSTITSEISAVKINGVAISSANLETLKSTHSISIDGSELNGLGMIGVTVTSGDAPTVTRTNTGNNAEFTFTYNEVDFTVTVTDVKKTYEAEGAVVYYSKNGTPATFSNENKTVTANGVEFEYSSRTFQYGEGSATLGSDVYKPLKLSTGEAVNVTFPTGKKATKIIVYGWSTNGDGWLKTLSETSSANFIFNNVAASSADMFYATNEATAIYPSVYEYDLSSYGGAWTSAYFYGAATTGQPFVMMDFVFADAPIITTQPVSANYEKNASTTALSVAAISSDENAVSYQWYSCTNAEKAGAVALTDETGATYTPSAAAAGVFYYYCAVTDGNGTTNTDVATIKVTSQTSTAIFSYTVTSTDVTTYGTAATGVTTTATMDASGSIGGTANFQVSTDGSGKEKGYFRTQNDNPVYTINGNAGYAFITLAGENKFQEGDIISIYGSVGTKGNGFNINTSNSTSSALKTTTYSGTSFDIVTATVDASRAGVSTLYIMRTGSATNINRITVTRYASTTITTNAGNWASFTPEWNCTLENGAKAYIITGVNESTLTGEEVAVLEVGKGYFIKGDVASHAYTATATDADATSTEGNLVVGCATNTEINGSGNTKYILGTNASGAGLFYVDSPITIPAGKAYLDAAKVIAAPARALSLDFEEGETTSLNEVRGLKADVRGEFYNLNGQRVAQPTKGLYIVNGRKVVIK